MQLEQALMIDATADGVRLTISTTGTARLRIHAKEMADAKVTATG